MSFSIKTNSEIQEHGKPDHGPTVDASISSSSLPSQTDFETLRHDNTEVIVITEPPVPPQLNIYPNSSHPKHEPTILATSSNASALSLPKKPASIVITKPPAPLQLDIDNSNSKHASPQPATETASSNSSTLPFPTDFTIMQHKKPDAIVITKPPVPPQLDINNSNPSHSPLAVTSFFENVNTTDSHMSSTALPSPTPDTESSTKITSSIPPKDLKDRFNYASVDCAATIRSVSSETNGASSILNDNRDSYLLTPCFPSSISNNGTRHVVIELCNDILIDSLVLANLELFSSTFRFVAVSINSIYPETQDKPWRQLGDLHASNIRSPQAFLIRQSVTWAKFVRFDFLDQFGAQYFCPISHIKVYGTTMLEQYKRDAEPAPSTSQESVCNESNPGCSPLSLPPISMLHNRIPPPSLPPSVAKKMKMRFHRNTTSSGNLNPPNATTIDMLIPTSTGPYRSYVPFRPPKLPVLNHESVPTDHLQRTIPPINYTKIPDPHSFNSTMPYLSSTTNITSSAPTQLSNKDPSKTSTTFLATSSAPLSKPILVHTTVDTRPSAAILNDNGMKAPSKEPNLPPVSSSTHTTLLGSVPPQMKAATSTTELLPTETKAAPSTSSSVPLTSPPPPQEEGIYKVIMKRFSTIEANYKLLVQYMDDYATGINHVIRTNDELQNKYFSQAMAQLSQHVVTRLSHIRDELSQESEQLRYQIRNHEQATYEVLSQVMYRVRALEEEVTNQRRWINIHFLLFAFVVIAPWFKSLLVTMLQVSLAMPSGRFTQLTSPLRAKSLQFQDGPVDQDMQFTEGSPASISTFRSSLLSDSQITRSYNGKSSSRRGLGSFKSSRSCPSLNTPSVRQHYRFMGKSNIDHRPVYSHPLLSARPRIRTRRSSLTYFPPVHHSPFSGKIHIPANYKQVLVRVIEPRPQTAPGVLVGHKNPMTPVELRMPSSATSGPLESQSRARLPTLNLRTRVHPSHSETQLPIGAKSSSGGVQETDNDGKRDPAYKERAPACASSSSESYRSGVTDNQQYTDEEEGANLDCCVTSSYSITRKQSPVQYWRQRKRK